MTGSDIRGDPNSAWAHKIDEVRHPTRAVQAMSIHAKGKWNWTEVAIASGLASRPQKRIVPGPTQAHG